MYPVFRAILLVLALSTLAAGPALAQAKAPAPQAAPTQDNAAAPKADQGGRKIPVAIEHDDGDPLGARLAYRVKELLGRSSLMQPTSKDEKKIVIVLRTKEEFPGRPNVASIYSIAWLFSSKEGSLKYFLTSEAGVVDVPGMDQTAETILGKTDKLATTYGYLF